MDKDFYVSLPARGAVRVGGPDRRAFLQGLISNDVALLDSQPCVYACLLTPQGKFLHDFFMTEQGDTITLECEGGGRALHLHDTLKKFRLRSKITLECAENIDVYAINSTRPQAGSAPDPRHPAMGARSLQKPDLREAPFADWDRRRILLGIPDGSRDMIPEQSTLLESGIDHLHGLSLSKGCYMGQELTARMHYRGLAKKHLYPVRSTGGAPLPPPGTDILTGGHLAGTMRSSSGEIGLVLLKDGMIPNLLEAGMEVID